jgi:hypothetical protein
MPTPDFTAWLSSPCGRPQRWRGSMRPLSTKGTLGAPQAGGSPRRASAPFRAQQPCAIDRRACIETRVPRYLFHLRNDLNVEDQEGLELPNLEAALERAACFAVEMAAASVIESRKLDLRHRIEVATEAGQILGTVKFGDVLTIVS